MIRFFCACTSTAIIFQINKYDTFWLSSKYQLITDTNSSIRRNKGVKKLKPVTFSTMIYSMKLMMKPDAIT